MAQAMKECGSCPQKGREAMHPLSDFYRDRDDNVLPTCKECRREQVRAYYQRQKATEDERLRSRSSRVPNLAGATAIQSPSGPQYAIWHCLACWDKRITRIPGFPSGWREIQVPYKGKEQNVTLCGPCASEILKAKRIFSRVVERLANEQKMIGQAISESVRPRRRRKFRKETPPTPAQAQVEESAVQ